MRNRYALLLVVFFGQPVWSLAQPKALFQKGNKAFGQENYQEAIDAYEAVLKTGYYSKEVYFNLANAYLKKDNLGRAILNYERAHMLAPQDEDILHNLRLARLSQKDEMDSPVPLFTIEWARSLRSILPGNGWAWLAVCFVWLSAGLGIWKLLRPGSQLFRFYFPVLAAALAVAVFAAAMAWWSARETQRGDYAVVLAAQASLYRAPDPGSPVESVIHEGLKVQLTDRIGEWWEVELPDGARGWMQQGYAERI